MVIEIPKANIVISKALFVLIVTIWNAISIYIPLKFSWSVESILLVQTIGNAVIIWLGTETGYGANGKGKTA